MTRRPAARSARTPTRARISKPAASKPVPAEPLPPEPEAPPIPGPLLVEVDLEVTGWRTRSRFDVVLQGLVTSAAPLALISFRDAGGTELAAIEFGVREEPAGEPMDPEAGIRTGFQAYLSLPDADTAQIAEVWVRAEARDGAVFEEMMRLGYLQDQAVILGGPAHDLSGVELPRVRGVIYLEAAEIGAGGVLNLSGWVLSEAPVVAVQASSGGRRIGPAIFGRGRADVAEAHPDFPEAVHSGFELQQPIAASALGAQAITVRAFCLDGTGLSATLPLTLVPGSAEILAALAEAEVPDAADPGWDVGRAILLVCDMAILAARDTLKVAGWSACGRGIERISIEVDGVVAGEAEYGLERPDVAAEIQGIPVETGFTFEAVVPGLSIGSHEVRVIAFNSMGDEKDIAQPLVNPDGPAFQLHLDAPATQEGVALHPITGRLVIEGWALARDGMAGIDVAVNGVLMGPAHYGVARPDVGVAFQTWDGAARSGFTFHCPPRALADGVHVVQLTARSKLGETHEHSFQISVTKTDDPEQAASIRRRISRVERDTTEGVLAQLDCHPVFHLFVVSDGTAEEAARALTIRSILEQSWADWHVTVLAANKRDAAAQRGTIDRLAHDRAGQFVVANPAGTRVWDAPLAAATGTTLIGLLSAGDELGRDALGAFAVASGLHPAADFFYADEFRAQPGGGRPEAFFKPDFSPALLQSANYIGRPFMVRPRLLAAAGTTPRSLARDGFFDLVLRCGEAASEVHHVRALLSRTDGGVREAAESQSAALSRAIARRGIEAEVLPGHLPETWRVRRTTPVTGKVSIIIPTCAAKGYFEICLKTLRAVTSYRNYEIICVDNIPKANKAAKRFVRKHADRVIDAPDAFNWSRFNNRAAAASGGEFLLFLNDDIEIVQPDWLDAMLEDAADGIAGARLLYPNRTVQHAGMFLGDGMGRHAFRHAEETEPGYFGLALTRREVIAVTGACLLVRRDLFDRLGGFDEAHDVINNDLDFCLRAHRAGIRAIYTPYATLIHHELASRETLPEMFDTDRFKAEWRGLFAAGDPYFNPHLSRHSDDYLVDDEGVHAIYGGHPVFDRASVKAVLVVKLDHIGDFVTSLPAIRRLKTVFPAAKLVLLAAPASAAIAALEPAIDECVPFEFFHARSELGEKTLDNEDLDALTARLAPYRFDVAVDLRKHLSTRRILLCAGAKVLAGYDSLEAFPWLDISLEWDGDKSLQRKRSHIVDDLLNLVSAIDLACDTGRLLFEAKPVPMPVHEMPKPIRPLFARTVVAIHPGAGNVMKQLPEKHILALIALLIERNGVSVLLIGGGDDEERATSIVNRIAEPGRVASVAGLIPLRDLPRLLAACGLFIGSDSGPKHIAAASGVPTIGVHSGVIDPREWGPMGDRAVALHRDMSCAPCFLSRPEDCPRGLACIHLLDPALVHKMAETFLAVPSVPSPAVDASPVQKAARKSARLVVAK